MPSLFRSVEKMRLTHSILFWFIFPSVIKCLSLRNCPPTLTDTFQNQIVICTSTSHLNKRNSIYLDVEFEAFPKPNVTWILNKHVGQEKVLYPGDRSRGYRSFELRQDVRSLYFPWNSNYTVWKFQDFSVTLILREIEIGKSRISKCNNSYNSF